MLDLSDKSNSHCNTKIHLIFKVILQVFRIPDDYRLNSRPKLKAPSSASIQTRLPFLQICVIELLFFLLLHCSRNFKLCNRPSKLYELLDPSYLSKYWKFGARGAIWAVVWRTHISKITDIICENCLAISFQLSKPSSQNFTHGQENKISQFHFEILVTNFGHKK